MEKIRVGVVGVGYFGQFHVEKYVEIDDVELVGVADINPLRAQEIGRQYRIPSFLHHTDLFNKVQAVSIAVPTPSHYPIAKDFFLRGIDVFLEKPISNTLEEADELIELAESKGLIFQIGHLERFNGALLGMEGRLKNPLLIESRRLSPFTGRGTEVDVVLDLMVHDLDIILSLVDSKVRKLRAIGIPFLTSYSDIAHAFLEFENGCIAYLIASRVSQEKVRKTLIFQPEGIISIDYLFQKLSVSKKVVPLKGEENPTMMTEEIPVQKIDPLKAELLSFLQSVRKREKARVSGLDGRKTLELALQIQKEIHAHSSLKQG